MANTKKFKETTATKLLNQITDENIKNTPVNQIPLIAEEVKTTESSNISDEDLFIGNAVERKQKRIQLLVKQSIHNELKKISEETNISVNELFSKGAILLIERFRSFSKK